MGKVKYRSSMGRLGLGQFKVRVRIREGVGKVSLGSDLGKV